MDRTNFWWMRTVGAPSEGDPRDGELHQVFTDDLPLHQDIEPWDARDHEDDPGEAPKYDPATAGDARYWRNPVEPPETHEDGRPIWNYRYVPYGQEPSWR